MLLDLLGSKFYFLSNFIQCDIIKSLASTRSIIIIIVNVFISEAVHVDRLIDLLWPRTYKKPLFSLAFEKHLLLFFWAKEICCFPHTFTRTWWWSI